MGKRSKPAVMFLCIHNAGRSQMAAGWLNHLADGRIQVFSAGSEPASATNPTTVAVMSEVGVNIGAKQPRPWTDAMVRQADVIISMGCGDVCPVYPGKVYLEWEIEDPRSLPISDVRLIRDQIEARVRGLFDVLGVEI